MSLHSPLSTHHHVSGGFAGFVLPAQQRQNAQRHQGEFEEMFVLIAFCICGEVKSSRSTKEDLGFKATTLIDQFLFGGEKNLLNVLRCGTHCQDVTVYLAALC